jgi:hypothetical protein
MPHFAPIRLAHRAPPFDHLDWVGIVSSMKTFIIRLSDGNYVMHVRLSSNYLDYDRTRDREAADRLNDFDSQLVLKRLRNMGEKNPQREEVPADR